MTISNLLTYGLDSRLYKKLRGKKGLVYGISSDIELSATSKLDCICIIKNSKNYYKYLFTL